MRFEGSRSPPKPAHERDNERRQDVAKILKNIGPCDYNGAVNIPVGESCEVSDEAAVYLLSDDSPGAFEEVKAAKEVKAGK